MTPKQHRIWEVNQKKRLDLMEIETGTLKEVNGKILIEIWQEMIILIIIQLNKYETGLYFLQNFQCTTMLIPAFCKICEHEIVLQECKSKQKQFHVHNSYKTCE